MPERGRARDLRLSKHADLTLPLHVDALSEYSVSTSHVVKIISDHYFWTIDILE